MAHMWIWETASIRYVKQRKHTFCCSQNMAQSSVCRKQQMDIKCHNKFVIIKLFWWKRKCTRNRDIRQIAIRCQCWFVVCTFAWAQNGCTQFTYSLNSSSQFMITRTGLSHRLSSQFFLRLLRNIKLSCIESPLSSPFFIRPCTRCIWQCHKINLWHFSEFVNIRLHFRSIGVGGSEGSSSSIMKFFSN